MAVSLALSACGGGARQDAQEHRAHYAVRVPVAIFPATQDLAHRARMVIAVRNAGTKTMPNVAITITNPRYGTTAQAFAERLTNSYSDPSSPVLANSSRPIWVIDRGPGASICAASCQAAGGTGAGGGQTAYSNTWALGPLAPGHTKVFRWIVTAIQPGTHLVRYRVAAGLNGDAVAVLAGGGVPAGIFRVTVHSAPQQSYVDNSGRIVVIP